MPQAPEWMSTVITLPDAPLEPQTLQYRDIVECTRFLFSNPTFKGEMVYQPVEVFEDDPRLRRVFHEPNTGKLWNESQVGLHVGYILFS